MIRERLVAEYGFATGHLQRAKGFVAEAGCRVEVPRRPDQVDWGDEGDVSAHVGIRSVYSFHMTLRHSGTRPHASRPAWT